MPYRRDEKFMTIQSHSASGGSHSWLVTFAPTDGPMAVRRDGPTITVHAPPASHAAMQPAIAEFHRVIVALEQLEREVDSAWPFLDADRPLLFDAGPRDLRRSPEIGTRALATFERRARLARLEPIALVPEAAMSADARRLGRYLRRVARVASRFETLDSQLQVFEHVYEMASQRLGEFRAAYDGARIEWLIVALLAVEVVLMGFELIP